MGLLDRSLELLKRHEGYRQFLYDDSLGIPTVGFGRNLRDRGVDTEEAHYLLRNDIIHALHDLTEFDFWGSLNEVRQAVLVDMAVNMGFGRLKTFKKMLAAIQEGNYAGAAVEMVDSKWRDQVGQRAVELSEMMRTGV